jgi:hypothetical protein
MQITGHGGYAARIAGREQFKLEKSEGREVTDLRDVGFESAISDAEYAKIVTNADPELVKALNDFAFRKDN